MIIKKIIPIFPVVALWALAFLSCDKTTNETDSEDRPGETSTRIPARIPAFTGLCSELSVRDCKDATLTNAQGKKRFCVVANDKCEEAKECEQIKNLYCEDVLIDNKKCGSRNLKCMELFDCSSFATPADCKDKASLEKDGICVWSVQKNKCIAKYYYYATQDSALSLYSGGGTVCANTHFDSFLCWGDDTDKKYSAGFLPNAKIESMRFAKNFGCAIIETKAPTSLMSSDGEYGVKCWGGKPSIVNNAPQGKIDGPLVMNDHVACVMQKDGTEKRAKCWGDFSKVSSPNPGGLELGPDGLKRTFPMMGDFTLDVSEIALGEDFICAHAKNPLNSLQELLICSGKTNFSTVRVINDPKMRGVLTAGKDFACFTSSVKLHYGEAYCFKQPGLLWTFVDTFLFGGGLKYSPTVFVGWQLWAQNEFLCGIEETNKKLTCYNAPLSLAVPAAIKFHSHNFVFGDDYICGITEDKSKVHCWGNSNSPVVKSVPSSIRYE